jgi:hypothetical protein
MSATQISFLFVLLVTGAAVLSRGGRIERLVFALLVTAALLTPLVAWNGFVTPEWGVFIVDVTLLAVLVGVALSSDRYWPMFAAAAHLIGVAVHLARIVAPDILPWAYATGSALWSYPVFGALAGGALLESGRRREKR